MRQQTLNDGHASEKQGKEVDTETRFMEIVAENRRQHAEYVRRYDIMSPDRPDMDLMDHQLVHAGCSCQTQAICI